MPTIQPSNKKKSWLVASQSSPRLPLRPMLEAAAAAAAALIETLAPTILPLIMAAVIDTVEEAEAVGKTPLRAVLDANNEGALREPIVVVALAEEEQEAEGLLGADIEAHQRGRKHPQRSPLG